jgi:hypothetical protein
VQGLDSPKIIIRPIKMCTKASEECKCNGNKNPEILAAKTS